MAAKPHGDHVVVIGYPSTIADPCHAQAATCTVQAEGSGRRRLSGRAVCYLFIAAVAVIVATGVVIGIELPDEAPKYSVAVTAVAGLDPARDLTARGRPTLSPVLNVTVHIDNTRSAVRERCMSANYGGPFTAVVSYGDALLGKGTVPEFCARRRGHGEGVARAWGQDVVVPWFLRDELAAKLAAGDATVAVQLKPWSEVCYAKIGGGLSRCYA